MSNVWFDRYDISPNVPEHAETLKAGEDISNFVNDIMRSDNLPSNRIIIGNYLHPENFAICGFIK